MYRPGQSLRLSSIARLGVGTLLRTTDQVVGP